MEQSDTSGYMEKHLLIYIFDKTLNFKV